MVPITRRRVVVGVNGSLASLRALRLAVATARGRGSDLDVVYVRPPARPDRYDAYFLAEIQDLNQWLDRQADQQLGRWLDDALGLLPTDVRIHRHVASGKPGPVLVDLAWRDDDLLVLGIRSGRWWHGLRRHSVSHYCLTHADCPVLLVPPDAFARAVRHRPRLGGPLGHDVWKRFEAAAAERQHSR